MGKDREHREDHCDGYEVVIHDGNFKDLLRNNRQVKRNIVCCDLNVIFSSLYTHLLRRGERKILF